MPHVGHARAIPEEGSKGPLLLGFSSFTWLFLPRILTLQTLQYITKSPRWLELTLTKYFFLKFHNHEIMKLIGRRNNLLLHAVETSLNNLCILPCPVDPFLRVESKTLMMMLLGRRRLHGLQLPLNRRSLRVEPTTEGICPLDHAPERPAALTPLRKGGKVTNGVVKCICHLCTVPRLRPHHLLTFFHGFLLSWSCGQPDRVSFETIFFQTPHRTFGARCHLKGTSLLSNH
jgi:hypothetical protein